MTPLREAEMKLLERITLESGKRGGKPCVRGMRITVYDVLEWLASGMNLLLDQNLSRRLVPVLEPAYPGTSQVVLLGMERASDREIWQFAREQGFLIEVG